MKFILAALALMATATHAQERPAHIADFNGYTVTVSLSDSNKPTDYTPADAKAQEACESVGKAPQLQSRQSVSEWRFLLVYVCL